MITRMRNLFAVAVVATGCLLPSGAQAQSDGVPEVLAAIEAGKAALLAENWEQAITEVDRAIAIDDGTSTLLYFIKGEALRELEEYQDAIKSYVQALQADETFAQAYNGRGICYRELQQYDLAINDFVNAADNDRNDGGIAANLGDLWVNIYQDPTKALPYLDRAIEKNPEDAEAFRNRGWAHALTREFDEAIPDLNRAIELDPEDYETYQKLALALISEEDFEPGIDALNKAVQYYEPKDNSEPDTYVNGFLQLADVKMRLAKELESPEQKMDLYKQSAVSAEAVLDEFPDRFPQSGIALYRKGLALRMQGLYAEAITAFTDAIQLIPPGTDSNYIGEAFLLRGICWFYQDQIDLARGDFKEAASQSLVDSRPYLWIGYTYAKEGNYRKAIESYGEATAKNPNYALAYINRGLAYMQLEDYKKAIKNFNEAIRAEPTEPMHFFKRGKAHESLGEWQKALDSYQLALLRDGEFADANRGAARALRALGRPGLGDQYENRVN